LSLHDALPISSSYVLSQSDRAIAAERAVLHKAYEAAGRSGLIATIARSIADGRFEGGLYLLADPSFTPVAGNLKVWPSELRGVEGRANFSTPTCKPDPQPLRLLQPPFE